jgi:hypothetical protein
MTDRPSPEDDFLEAAAAHRDAVTIDTFVRAPDQPAEAEAEAVHDYADPYADLRARFNSHRVDEAGLDAMDIVRNSSFALGRTIEFHVPAGPRRERILDDLQQVMFAANHEIARSRSLGLAVREPKEQ